MIADPQGHAVVLAGDPARQPLTVRHQPGVRAWPGARQAVQPTFGQVFQQKIELLDAIGHENQALLHWPFLQRQQAVHRVAVPRVATQSPDRFGRIGDDATTPDHPRRLLHTPVTDHSHPR